MRAFASAVVLALVAAACSSAPAARSTTAATASGAATSATAIASAPAAPAQAYLRLQLTDVRTGERFTLGGSGGKTVIVEGMAVW